MPVSIVHVLAASNGRTKIPQSISLIVLLPLFQFRSQTFCEARPRRKATKAFKGLVGVPQVKKMTGYVSALKRRTVPSFAVTRISLPSSL